MWVCLVCLQLCKEEGSSLFAIIEMMDMYGVPLYGVYGVYGTLLANLHMCGIMLV